MIIVLALAGLFSGLTALVLALVNGNSLMFALAMYPVAGFLGILVAATFVYLRSLRGQNRRAMSFGAGTSTVH